VFAASVLAEAKFSNKCSPNLIVDTCSSPGGKAIYAWRACNPKRLVCNEVIGSRLSALISNIKRCRITPTIVTNADTAHLAVSIGETADIVLVDAPCSGQSLPAKGAKAFGAFHPATINMNSNRQKRILANSAKIVAPGGYLAYMTCTFSLDENEGVIKWFLKRFPNFEPQIVPHLEDFRSRISEFPCYRLMPHQGLGAGAFTCLLKNNQSSETEPLPNWQALKCVWRNDQIPKTGT
jgi:16S rRNA C967 or C1407 C5-methylase (RsmB/RsmF family)